MNLRRETLKSVTEAIRYRMLTDEDLIKINQIILDRVEKLEKDQEADAK